MSSIIEKSASELINGDIVIAPKLSTEVMITSVPVPVEDSTDVRVQCSAVDSMYEGSVLYFVVDASHVFAIKNTVTIPQTTLDALITSSKKLHDLVHKEDDMDDTSSDRSQR